MDTFYLVYKITNNIDGKRYIGVHKTNDINDSYMGSGKILKRAIKKYGIENFTKEILAVFDTPEDMYQIESVLVNEEFIKRDDTYNIKHGGLGGWDHINANRLYGALDTETRKRVSKSGVLAWKKLYNNDDTFREKIHGSCAKALSVAMKNNPEGTWKGKRHKESSKRLIGDKNSIAQAGNKNSQYATCWIYNEHENKKIKKEDLAWYLSVGWTKGRLYKN